MARSVFKWIPEDAKLPYKPRRKSVQFGGGYEQRSKDGINSNLRTFNLSFKGSPQEMREIRDFLNEHEDGTAFIYNHPHEPPALVTFDTVDLDDTDYFLSSLSVTFREVVS